MYGVKNRTRPMSRNASRSRVSMDNSFFLPGEPPGWMGVFSISAIRMEAF
jgi:hypothetical protein